MLETIREFLKGKKTYLAGLAVIVAQIIQFVETGQLDWNLLATAIMGMFIRAGVEKVN